MKNSFILLVLIVLISRQNAIPKHETVNNIFKSDILKVIDEVSKLEGLIESNSSTVELQQQFLKRTQQLQTSTISEYYFPAVSKAINGPACQNLKKMRKTLLPKDFIEEFIFRHIIQNQKRRFAERNGYSIG
jgi:cytochrome c peroxidase